MRTSDIYNIKDKKITFNNHLKNLKDYKFIDIFDNMFKMLDNKNDANLLEIKNNKIEIIELDDDKSDDTSENINMEQFAYN